MSREQLPLPSQAAINASNVSLTSIARDGIITNWVTSAGAAEQFLESDGDGNLIWGSPSGGGNISSALNFTSENYITTTDIINGLKNIQETGVVIDSTNNIYGMTSITSPIVNTITDLNVKGASHINFLDIFNANAISIGSPTTLSASYSLKLPTTAPTSLQEMRTAIASANQLEWFSPHSLLLPTTTRIIYVSINGNNVTGNGSEDLPYATIAYAISLANTISTVETPVTIQITPGIYVENNSSGPIAITAQGISIVGTVSSSVIIQPNTTSNALFTTSITVQISNITLSTNSSTNVAFIQSGPSNTSSFQFMKIIGFQTGISLTGTNSQYLMRSIVFQSNTTSVLINNTAAVIITCVITGSISEPANIGIILIGASSKLILLSGTITKCTTGLNLTGGLCGCTGTVYMTNTNSIYASNGAITYFSGIQINQTVSSSDVAVTCTGAFTSVEIIGSYLSGFNPTTGLVNGTGILVSAGGIIQCTTCELANYSNAAIAGISLDTSSTKLLISFTSFNYNTTDIQQNGTSTLQISSVVADINKISINNSTNVLLSFIDITTGTLSIGNLSLVNNILLQPLQSTSNNPKFIFYPNIYGNSSFATLETDNNSSAFSTISNADIWYNGITTSDLHSATIRLVSDTTSPIGSTTSLRGWDISKNNTTNAQLDFNFQNTDLNGLSPISKFTILELDGVINQLLFPTAGTKLNFSSDTNLYRASSGILQTDNNFIIGGLTANTAIYANTSKQLTSSTTSALELSYLTGVTSSVQTQLNSKVSKSGGTMSGNLTIPAGNSTTPSLNFTSSTTTGLAAIGDTLSLITNGVEALHISTGIVTIDNLTTGVVHSVNGALTSSLVTATDITNGTITNNKLSTVTSSDTANYIVVRDGTGNFATHMITIDGITSNPTDVATKAYVDTSIGLGLTVHTPAVVVSTSNLASLSGFPTIDSYTVQNLDRVLLIAQLTTAQNGLWVAGAGAWSRPTDFATGTVAGTAYVLITGGIINMGSSFTCGTPNAIIDTNPITFSLFMIPNTTTGANVGTGLGQIYQGKIGNVLNFKTILQGTHIIVTNDANDVAISTDATNLNTASTIVARDGSGNFSAGIITANLTGHSSLDLALTGGTLSGALTIPAGTSTIPSINFTSSTTTGLAAVSNALSIITNGTEAINISSAGIVSINNLTTGVVHSTNGTLTSSLIVNADITNGTIANNKLATLTAANLVANSATSATNLNTASTIVSRDGLGNFSAGIITANLIGSVTGHSSLDLALSGGTLSGNLILPGGSTSTPSLTFTGSTTTGLSAAADKLSINTSGVERININSSGIIAVDAFTIAGIVHNNSSGALTSSLIVDADISSSAAIANNKLATLTTNGLVANSATTATNSNTSSAIVARDISGNFSAGTITANLSGNVTGHSSLDLALTGGIMTGNITLPAGSSTTPTLNFTASTTTGLTAVSNVLSLITNGVERININSIGVVTINSFNTAGIVHNSSAGALSTGPVSLTTDVTGILPNANTTAVSTNTASAIVARDASGNFTAGTITASLTGHSSLDLALTGGTLSGALTIPAGTSSMPSLNFTGSTTTGISCISNALSVDVSAIEIAKFTSAGLTIDAFNTAGIVHNNASGLLSSSLVSLTTDVTGILPNANTTATTAATASTIVLRNSNGSIPITNIVLNSTSTDTTNSNNDAILTGMSTTPAAGTYLVFFDSTMSESKTNATGTFSIYTNGTQIAGSVRSLTPVSATIGVTSQAMVTVNGSQVVSVQWSSKPASSTCSCYQRTMSLLLVG